MTNASPSIETRRRSEGGFNLIELLIAIALLGVVVLSLMTLFALARSNVTSGRQMTHAISVGTRIMEDLSGLAIDDIYANHNITNATALSDFTVAPATLPESTYDDAIQRSSVNVANAGTGCTGATLITFTNDPRQFMQRWYCQLAGANSDKINDGQITLVFTPRQRLDTTLALSPENASIVKVRVILRWREGVRRRQVIFDTTKFNRPNPT
ncbi:MAG TPA: prepilin-type N-terminal cleavage/methylation domain-containing protein [Thermoanaerobaculia bacterium]